MPCFSYKYSKFSGRDDVFASNLLSGMKPSKAIYKSGLTSLAIPVNMIIFQFWIQTLQHSHFPQIPTICSEQALFL